MKKPVVKVVCEVDYKSRRAYLKALERYGNLWEAVYRVHSTDPSRTFAIFQKRS